jgi:hypothetical protein
MFSISIIARPPVTTNILTTDDTDDTDGSLWISGRWATTGRPFAPEEEAGATGKVAGDRLQRGRRDNRYLIAFLEIAGHFRQVASRDADCDRHGAYLAVCEHQHKASLQGLPIESTLCTLSIESTLSARTILSALPAEATRSALSAKSTLRT